jgi:DNA-binding GntR family transcriptional regulator
VFVEETGLPRPRKITTEAQSGQAASAALPDALTSRFNAALPKTAQVYDLLRRAIVTLVLTPGSIINEKQICDQLGISRTPLREAILQLNAESLVSVIPHSGTYVARIDLQNVFDGQLVRDALEMKIVRLAATKMTSMFERQLDFNLHQQRRLAQELDYDGFYELDEEFHSMICEFAASPRIWRIVNGAKAQLDRVRRLAFPVPAHLDIVLREHADIVAALKARDPDAADTAMKVHLDRVFDTIRRLITERADYFSSFSPDELDQYEGALRGKQRQSEPL